MKQNNNVIEIDSESDDEIEDSVDKRTIFCGNLNEKVTEEMLFELFLQCGPLQSAIIPKGTDGRQRTFGFVTFKHLCSVPYAFELLENVKLFNQDLILKNRTSRIPQTPQTPPPISNTSHYNNSMRIPNGVNMNLPSPVFAHPFLNTMGSYPNMMARENLVHQLLNQYTNPAFFHRQFH